MKKIFTIIASIALLNGITNAQDSVYIYKSGAVAYKQAVTNIDSVVFYKAIPPANSITDIEGNVYKTVTIGTQTWMAENLRTAKYNDNSPIPNVTSATDWINLTTAAQCSYNNLTDSLVIYGRYYNWYAANTGKLCPTGWHVPTDDEFNTLETFLDNTVSTTVSGTPTGTTIGGQLKATGLSHWTTPNTGATNSSGFNAIAAGYRWFSDGTFVATRVQAWFMTITAPNSTNTWTRRLFYDKSTIERTNYSKIYGISVRCLKN